MILLAIWLVFSAPCLAEPVDPEGLVQQGKAAWEAGNLEETALMFERAFDAFADRERRGGIAFWIGEVYAERVDYPRAIASFRRSLDIRLEVLGPAHPDVSYTRYELSKTLHRFGQPEEATAQLARAISDSEGVPPAHMAEFKRGMAVMLYGTEQWAEALELVDQAQQIYEEEGTFDGELAAAVHQTRGALLRSSGELALAEESMLAALRNRERIDPHSTQVVTTLNSLGVTSYDRGDIATAIGYLERAIQTGLEVYPPEDPYLAFVESNLAGMYSDLGRYGEARRMYEDAIEVMEKSVGADSPKLMSALSLLAHLLFTQADHAGAAALYERVLETHLRQHGDAHSHTLKAKANLANAYYEIDRLHDAETLLREVLEVELNRPDRAVDQVVNATAGLGALLHRKGDHEAAEAYALEALALAEQAYGTDHIKVAYRLQNVVSVQIGAGKLDAAQAGVSRLREMTTREYGQRHPRVAEILAFEAQIAAKRGDADRSRARRREAFELVVDFTNTVLPTESERSALLFMAGNRVVLDQVLAETVEPAAAWSAILKWKGAVARTTAARRQAARYAHDPEVAQTALELADARKEMADTLFAPDATSPMRDDSLARVMALERRLADVSASYRRQLEGRSADVAAMCAAIPEGAVLVDFMEYAAEKRARYLAIVVDSSCAIRRVELGEANTLNEVVEGWRLSLAGRDATSRIDRRGQRVRERLWDPLLVDASWVFVVPDGVVASVSFGALPTDNGYLVESTRFSALDDATDLLREPSPTGDGALFVGDVDYGAPQVSTRPCVPTDFSPLPGTRSELDVAQRRWPRRLTPPTLLDGPSATERAVRESMTGKAIVHLATHGFFATESCASALETGTGLDPMLLSGVVLSGANQPKSGEDGLLTAADVASLDLDETRLVVLSACDSGRGEIRSGQGVLGLRRAFSTAGAQGLIMSLWAVPDGPTAMLMDTLYDALLHKRRPATPSEALARAQRTMLARNRADGDARPSDWAAFIAAGPE